jgi:hypothetical protein
MHKTDDHPDEVTLQLPVRVFHGKPATAEHIVALPEPDSR